MSSPAEDALLRELETRMATANLRGQWQLDANRPQIVKKSPNGMVSTEPLPAGKPHAWRWSDLSPLLEFSCRAMTESYTARRALILTNPGLQRGTTGNLLASLQVVKPGEIAWAHRHTMNALRFTIQGGPKVYTVVDGRALPMEPYDLILTPGWTWHDHHNESDADAIWLDGLDVPVTLALSQPFYEELGETSQERRSADLTGLMRHPAHVGGIAARPYRYPWAETRKSIEAASAAAPDPFRGHSLEFVNPVSGGSVLSTIGCQVQVLPPGFDGRPHRTSASSISFVVGGEGRTELVDQQIEWGRHDSIAIPNWTWVRHVNRSSRGPAILFTLTDAPLLSVLGFLREQTEDAPDSLARPAPQPVRPAAE